MKLPAPAGNAPAEPAMPTPAPAEAPTEDLDFGGETPTDTTTPEMPEAPADDNPFDKEPFDAGIDVDEDSDPKKFIQKLSGKIGQSLRDYTKKQGQPDFELEKFAINSLVSATHTAEMDENDRNDIIKKINNAGENDSENPDMGDDNNESGDEFGGDMGDDENSNEEDLQELSIYESEMGSLFLDKPKKNEMFQPGSNDFLDEDGGCWSNAERVPGTKKGTKGSCRLKEELTKENIEEGESNNYMFWQNLKGIYDDATEILEMNHQEVDNLIGDGHQWALEHVITSKDDVEEVYHFIESNIEGEKIYEGEHESNNYMFWSSLKTIQHASKELLKMDYGSVDMLLNDGHGWALDHIATSADDMEEVYHFLANTLDAYDGDTEGGYEDEYGSVEVVNLNEAKYHNKTVKLGKPSSGDVKKFKVYVKNRKGNVVKINFGDPNMEIKRDNLKRRKSFRARHKCSQAKDRTTPKYWSCKMWSNKPVSDIVGENLTVNEKNVILDKKMLKLKLQETFNQENMSEPLVEPIVKPPITKPAEPAPSRRNSPYIIEPDTIPQIDPKAIK